MERIRSRGTWAVLVVFALAATAVWALDSLSPDDDTDDDATTTTMTVTTMGTPVLSVTSPGEASYPQVCIDPGEDYQLNCAFDPPLSGEDSTCFTWYKQSGPSGNWLDDDGTKAPTFSSTEPGAYVYQVEYWDGQNYYASGFSSPICVVGDVSIWSSAPLCDGDYTFAYGEPIYLESYIDPPDVTDAQDAAFQWSVVSQGAGGSFSDATAQNTLFSPSGPGEYQLKVAITACGNTYSATTQTLTFAQVAIQQTDPFYVVKNEETSLSATASPTSAGSEYSWSVTNGGSGTWNPTSAEGQTVGLTLSSDGERTVQVSYGGPNTISAPTDTISVIPISGSMSVCDSSVSINTNIPITAYLEPYPVEGSVTWSITSAPGPGQLDGDRFGATFRGDAPGDYTIEMAYQRGDAVAISTATLTVCKVGSIQYRRTEADDWGDLPGEPLKVMLHDELYFKALIEPAGAEWPEGDLGWGHGGFGGLYDYPDASVAVANTDTVSEGPGIPHEIAASCGNQNPMAVAQFYVCGAEILLRPMGETEYASTATVCPGGLDTPIHKGEFLARTVPVAYEGVTLDVQGPSGGWGVERPFDVTTPDPVTDSNGEVTGTFRSSDTIYSPWIDVYHEASQYSLCYANVGYSWHDFTLGSEFKLPPFFVTEVIDELTFYATWKPGMPIAGHDMNFGVESIRLEVTEKNTDTGVTTTDTWTYTESPGTGERSFEELPFGTSLEHYVKIGGTTEGDPGVYTGTQAVHDYTETKGSIFKSAKVISYVPHVLDSDVKGE